MNKYGHNSFEVLLMIIITALTNGVMLFNIMLQIRKHSAHGIFLTILIFITSFMYHFCESVGVEEIFLQESAWHQLDNIGSICVFMEIFSYFMQNDYTTRINIAWIHFIIVIILQQDHTYDLWATLIPIIVGIVLLPIKLMFIPSKKKRLPAKKYFFQRGIILFFIGILAFYKGLDEYNDYLRIWHGIWHLAIGTSFFHLYQIYDVETYTMTSVWISKEKNQQFIII